MLLVHDLRWGRVWAPFALLMSPFGDWLFRLFAFRCTLVLVSFPKV